MNEELRKLLSSVTIPAIFVGLLWCIKLVEFFTGFDFGFLGVYPRTLAGTIGIIGTPLVHGGFGHLISNSVPLLFLGAGIIYFYPKVAMKFFLRSWLLSGVILFIIGRSTTHIGASGVVFAMAFFLFWSGIFRKDKTSMAVSLLVTFFYGSMIWGLFPIEQGVSWEGHIAGAIVGTVYAFAYRNVDPPEKLELEDDPTDGPEYRTYKYG